jgi:predicted  nucleic acid-binding Zn-ribbon protein
MPPEPQIVNILGEQVAFEPTGLSPSEKAIVQFDQKYKYPDMSDAEALVLKKLFRTLFSGSSAFLPAKQSPSPPCSDKEKAILLHSLEHRFASLRNELIVERKSQSDSLRLRQIMDHLERLKQYIDFMRTTTSCQELQEDILAESLGDLTDEQIQQLLKQFVFFLLQGQHPLPAFTGRDPNPKGFVARLERKPITDFDVFLDQYKQKKYPIAPLLSKVLEGTGLDLEAVQSQINAAVENKLKSILVLISDVIDRSDPFWKNLDRNNLEAVVQRLLETIESLKSDLEECEKDYQNVEGAMIDLHNQKDQLEQEKEALQQKLQILEFEFNTFKKTAIADGIPEADVDAIREEAEKQIAAYKQQLEEATAKCDELQSKYDTLSEQFTGLQRTLQEKQKQIDAFTGKEEELVKLRETVASLQEQLAAAVKKAEGCDELQVKVTALEAEVKGKEDQLAELRAKAGDLTKEIDAHLQEKAALSERLKLFEGEAERAASFVSTLEGITESLSQDKSIVLGLLGDIQRTRASYVSSEDPLLQQIVDLRSSLESTDTIDPSLASKVAALLKAAQEELAAKQKEVEGIRQQLQDTEGKIEAAEKAMKESNSILAQIRSGREDLDTKGFKYASDKEFLENAFKAVEAEKELAQAKQELEAANQILSNKNAALTSDMEAIRSRLQGDLDRLRTDFAATSSALQAEREKSSSLEGERLALESERDSIQRSLETSKEEVASLTEALRKEKEDSQRRIRDLEATKLRECEERLAALRSEEEAKRNELVGTQGQAAESLQKQIAELLTRITAIEGERDSYKAQLEAEKGAAAKKEADCEEALRLANDKVKSLEDELRRLTESNREAASLLQTAERKLAAYTEEVEELRAALQKDRLENNELFELLTKVTDWISSKGTEEEPVIDEELDQKYGVSRVISAFLSSLPLEEEEEAVGAGAGTTAAMARCYLVFFMTYVYARHFPSRMDSEYNYQSIIAGFFDGVLKEIYTQLEAGIPGKLEKVGSTIPLQLKSKYLMNLLMPLIEQMELVHEKGTRGADFLKFSLLTQDQLETLHIAHTILKDKIRLTKDILITMNNYFKRRSGNVDEDISHLYLRFYFETKSNKEYPVIMYIKPETVDIPKITFATETDFSQYLSSTVKKETVDTVSSQMGASLKKSPVFSFPLLFYFFLFVVKDYLSSVEGELNKAGCPLPPILKSKRR